MSWADLADEIIVVDSRSNDGTFELIKQKLHHPNLRLIQEIVDFTNLGMRALLQRLVTGFISVQQAIPLKEHI